MSGASIYSLADGSHARQESAAWARFSAPASVMEFCSGWLAILCGQVHWGGGYWSAGQYLDMSLRWVRQRGLHGMLRLMLDGAGVTQRERSDPAEDSRTPATPALIPGRR